MLTLGVETSCDETSVAVVDSGRVILSNVILSQTEHAAFGGVVPEVASRTHLKTIVPVYNKALDDAGVDLERIELIAATMGPGLVGPLLVGLSFAKGLAFARNIPFVPVNHIEGHIAANILQHPALDAHHLTLIVSGGHTMLVEIDGFGNYNVLGRTKDDAAGEAFDKVAKLLELGYPGGPKLNVLAAEGNPGYFRFPRAMRSSRDYQFSFSGLKTAVAVYLQKLPPSQYEEHRADVAASFQEAAVEVLVDKTVEAAREMKVEHVTISGGVAANTRLRELMTRRLKKAGKRLFVPSPELCTDNAAMIAAAGFYHYESRGPGELIANAIPNLSLT